MRELFIEELEQVVGGRRKPPCQCCLPSTMACCEEAPPCDTCCDGGPVEL
jgi:hypothetical protein